MTALPDSAELAHFLRAARARMTPADAGLPTTARRRLSGLRRSEVAALAGISLEYYIRLEQGRQRHPSPSVLDALATALILDSDGRDHLHRLAAGGRPARPSAGSGFPGPALETTLRLLHSLTPWPAHVVAPTRDIVAWNAAAAWLMVDFAVLPEDERNFAWFVFCDPRASDLFADWESVARSNVRRLRHALATDPRSLRGRQLVERLSATSDTFTALWEEHGVRGPNTGLKKFIHPEGGLLELDYTAYTVPGEQQMELVVLTAEEHTPTYKALDEAARGRSRAGRGGVAGPH